MSFKNADYFIEKISAGDAVAMFKPGCPFCSASLSLIQALTQSAVITNFSIFTLDQDFTNETLLAVCSHFGWKPDGIQTYPSKPQIFIHKTLVGGNSEFYKSSWNIDDGMPQLANPMRF